MSRKKRSEPRKIYPDSLYGSIIVTKLVNYLMVNGNKARAEKIVINSLKYSSRKCHESEVQFLEKLVDNIKPEYEVKSRRIGGSTYQVPIDVRGARATSLALKWLVMFAKKRSHDKGMENKLSSEMCDAFYKKGLAVKKMEDTHKMAQANQAFAHYRW